MGELESQEKILVIGGTGMLSGLVLALCRMGHAVTVVARSNERLSRLQSNVSGLNNPLITISADYTNADDFISTIRSSELENGPYSIVISWIHSTSSETAGMLEKHFNHSQSCKRFIRIVGSGGIPLSKSEYKPDDNDLRNCHYVKLLLGFKIQGAMSRWLTHPEIVNGVLEAIETTEETLIVGLLEPQEKMPSFYG